jgi:hypothetical protein
VTWKEFLSSTSIAFSVSNTLFLLLYYLAKRNFSPLLLSFQFLAIILRWNRQLNVQILACRLVSDPLQPKLTLVTAAALPPP